MSADFASPIPRAKTAEEVLEHARRASRKVACFNQGGYQFTTYADHILESLCRHTEREECMKCQYEKTLALPELPEMVFPKTRLTIRFNNSIIEFNALDALLLVNANNLPDFQVGASAIWQEARKEKLKGITEQHKPFDWSFTTFYKGTLHNCSAKPTDEKIDMERLKRHDPIAFINTLILFEDELADHGIAQLSVRIRVMSNGYFFVLLRFYLRVDDVMIRVCDTRLVGENNQGRVLREWQLREAKISELDPSKMEFLRDVNQAWQHLPLKESVLEVISADE